MARVRRLRIENFRSIRSLPGWFPTSGLNCLFGPGDSGKSTILNALDLVLSPARQQRDFSDADFFRLEVKRPIVIEVVIGDLDDSLKQLEPYGLYLCGFDAASGILKDEPDEASGLETVLVRRLEVASDLEPRWRLLSPRVPEDGRDLAWQDRRELTPARLGTYTGADFAFGGRSALSRAAGPDFAGANALAEAARQARLKFSEAVGDQLDTVLELVRRCAAEMNVPAAQVKALLDAHAASVSQSGIALHDEHQIPLRALGTGSARLLAAALQKEVAGSRIILADEIEHALEPYRTLKLLRVLGSKATDGPQVFLTTHSPVVLCEIGIGGLFRVYAEGAVDAPSHAVLTPEGDGSQATVRACPSAFLSRSVLICEGKTEVGLLRGLEIYGEQEGTGAFGFAARGACLADGGGGSKVKRLKTFQSLGYRTALMLDGDCREDDGPVAEMESLQVKVFRCSAGHAMEQELFEGVPLDCLAKLLQVAIAHLGAQAVDSDLSNHGLSLDTGQKHPEEGMRPGLGVAAKDGRWFKDMGVAERVGREVLGPCRGITGRLKEMLQGIEDWLAAGGGGREP